MTAENRTICEKYKDYIIRKREDLGDLQTIYRFPNGYGASVIQHYELWSGACGVVF